ncbi:MAG TPA: glycosyltransferase family A protein [Steroidobacteraceae bacterium]|nr:glycosyltransferase family A protein [Steroidobacteraceae bacterium]
MFQYRRLSVTGDAIRVELILSCFWFLMVLWLLSRAYRQRQIFARVTLGAARPKKIPPRVAVIVPVRDERANIGPCVQSLLRQQYPADRLHVLVVDDDSSDGTPEIVAKLAEQDERVSFMRTPPLPPSWKGKPHACWIGSQTIPADTQWLCFLDADMRADPALMTSALAAALEGKIDLLTVSPRHELHTFAERLVIPCGLYLLGFCQDLAKLQAPDSHEVVATGQFMLVRREAYEDVGGHAAVSTAICEDLELARLLKRRGHRVLLKDGSRLLATRMYTGWQTLWPGIAKNLSHMLGGPVRTIVLATIAVITAWGALVLPAFDIADCVSGTSGACAALVPAGLGSIAIIAMHIAGAAHFQIPPWYGLLFPVSYTAAGMIAVDSVRSRLMRRVRWKGRVYQ